MIKKGDTIGIISLAGTCEQEFVDKAKSNIEALGYNVKLSKNIYSKNRYLSGTDEEKIEELHSFFQDSEIKLILNARGGYGSIRLINKINYEIIKTNPMTQTNFLYFFTNICKLFIGTSPLYFTSAFFANTVSGIYQCYSPYKIQL